MCPFPQISSTPPPPPQKKKKKKLSCIWQCHVTAFLTLGGWDNRGRGRRWWSPWEPMPGRATRFATFLTGRQGRQHFLLSEICSFQRATSICDVFFCCPGNHFLLRVWEHFLFLLQFKKFLEREIAKNVNFCCSGGPGPRQAGNRDTARATDTQARWVSYYNGWWNNKLSSPRAESARTVREAPL